MLANAMASWMVVVTERVRCPISAPKAPGIQDVGHLSEHTQVQIECIFYSGNIFLCLLLGATWYTFKMGSFNEECKQH